jgi:DNA-binding MarR family transcriptional regulator
MEISSGQMCEDLFALLRRIKSAMIEVAEAYGMTPAQVGALYAIMHGDTTMGRVAQTLHCDASNATGIVDRLVAQDLVIRKEGEQDRRVKTLHLTPKGQEIINEIVQKLPTVIGCDKLTSQERTLMHVSISKLAVA